MYHRAAEVVIFVITGRLENVFCRPHILQRSYLYLNSHASLSVVRGVLSSRDSRACIEDLQGELAQLQQRKPRQLLPRVKEAVSKAPSPQLSAFFETGWRHPSGDSEYVARLNTMMVELTATSAQHPHELMSESTKDFLVQLLQVDVLKESDELFSYLQKTFRLVQRLQTESRQEPSVDGDPSSSSRKEDAGADLVLINEDGVEWDGVDIEVDVAQNVEYVESESIRRRDERIWAVAAILSSLEADLMLKRRIVSAVTQTPDTTPGQMQVRLFKWRERHSRETKNLPHMVLCASMREFLKM
eukprot:278891-Prorocentrum_minimum.AAC.9